MAATSILAQRKAARLVVGIAVGLGLLVGGAAFADAAMGIVRTQQTPLTVRSGPGTAYPAVGSVAKGATLQIDCTVRGERVVGRFGASSTWNRLGPGRFVSDAYVRSTERAPACVDEPVASTVAGMKPCSFDEGAYANGRVPRRALCPLRGEHGESLRPRAAAAFNALSRAYQKSTGKPLCVTDSYRAFDEQVAVKAARGKWAATPGRSEHGLGQALDLCGGVNRFGTAAHQWMKQNAPRYGWVHPAWAEANGTLPEPWHWEFTG